MDLEQRVRALEQEVQLLKAQIQATLLDIQEQLLSNAHPVLRSDGESASAEGKQKREPAQAANAEETQPAPLLSQAVVTAAARQGQRSTERPVVRRFSLDDNAESESESNANDAADEPSVTVAPIAVQKALPNPPKPSNSSNGHKRATPPPEQPIRSAITASGEDKSSRVPPFSPAPNMAADDPFSAADDNAESHGGSASESIAKLERYSGAKPDKTHAPDRNMLLRLITGVMGSDVNVKWKKRNG